MFPAPDPRDMEEEEEPDPPRNFTVFQLAHFDGTKEEKSGDDKDVYLSVNGLVFNVTKGRDFYGPGGPYESVRNVTLCFWLLRLTLLVCAVCWT